MPSPLSVAEELFLRSSDFIMLLELDGRVAALNAVVAEMLGRSADSIIGMDLKLLMDNADDGADEKSLDRSMIFFTGSFGSRIFRVSKSQIADIKGRAIGSLVCGVDVTDAAKMETELRESLQHKDLLMKEINHRVKNNFQIIQSLISLQEDRVEDETAKKVLAESRARISTIHLVHEKMCQTGALVSFYAMGKNKVRLVAQIEDVHVSIKGAMHCDMIINELATNSMKYAAVPDGGEIVLEVTGRSADGFMEIEFGDNGPGLSPVIDISKVFTLGLKIVSTIVVKQLFGKFEQVKSPGARFGIRIPLNELKPENLAEKYSK